VVVPYYTAVVAGGDHDWELVPADLEDLEDAGDVADAVRRATGGRGGVAIIEHEDDWFALVRVEGEEDPRVFVSDVDAMAEGHYARLAADLGDGPDGIAGFDGDLVAGDDVGDGEPDEDDVTGSGPLSEAPDPGRSWGGDPGLLEDCGLPAAHLTGLVEEAPDPGAAVVEIAKRLGFDDLVDVWR
jgi:putative tRNA adenosine deaminase-associated protein